MSCCSPVSVMQSTENRFGNDFAISRRFDDPGKWRVVIQGLVRTRIVVVVDVFREDPYQMRFVEDDDMVKTVSTNCTDHTFNERILPGRTWRDYDLLDSHMIESLLEVFAVYAITITNQVFRRIVEGEGFNDLLCGPSRLRMCGNVEVNQFAPIESKHDEAVEHSEVDRGDGEEVDRGDVLHVVLQE